VPPVDAASSEQQRFLADALAFDRDALLAGRSCRDALARVCAWHRARGMTVDCP
jgi:hypothetical protein